MAVRLSIGDDIASAKPSTSVKSGEAETLLRPLHELELEGYSSVSKAGDGAMKCSAGKASHYESAVEDAKATYKSVISDMVRANKSNPITEENYYSIHWLYRIRRVSCARGIRIGFLQPDFLCVVLGPMMPSKMLLKLRRTNTDIREAVEIRW